MATSRSFSSSAIVASMDFANASSRTPWTISYVPPSLDVSGNDEAIPFGTR